MKKEYKFKGIIFKSFIELYFAYYLQELQDSGYIKEWAYEKLCFILTEPYSRQYKKQLKSKVKTEEEFLLSKSSIQEDFYIEWDKKAENIFYLNPNIPIKKPVKKIPFRLSTKDVSNKLITLVETKGFNSSAVSSNTSFPYKQKFLLYKEGLYIQKVYPFSYKKSKKTLFRDTFMPDRVLQSETYINTTVYGKKGDSKIKYPVKTLSEFIKLNKN